MRALGLDPGTRHFGWGVVERQGTRFLHVAHGVVSPGEGLPLGERLVAIERALLAVIELHRPSCAALEAIFFAKDAQAAMKLGHARGVAMLVCARADLELGEYAPTRVKQAVVGSGRSDKTQVALMVRAVLGLVEVPKSDAADALAIALTHLKKSVFSELTARPITARVPSTAGRPRRMR